MRAAGPTRSRPPGRVEAATSPGPEAPRRMPDFPDASDLHAPLRHDVRFLGERRVHLETAGAHVAELESLLTLTDHVGLGLKLAGDLDEPVPMGTGGTADVALPRSAEDWAAALDTIGYEIVCGISSRIPRVPRRSIDH